MNDLRIVKFKETQGAEDLFFCPDRNTVYLRQPCDDDYVRWLTTSKWAGGYEANAPMRTGLTIRVIGDNGDTLFEEEITKQPGYSDTVAAKKASFHADVLKDMTADMQKRYSLKGYDEWRNWLLQMKPASYAGYDDSWLFCENQTVELKHVEAIRVYGKVHSLVRYHIRHKLSGAEYTEYHLESKNGLVVSHFGYGFPLNDSDDIHAPEELLHFNHNGKRYSMSREAIYAAYCYQEELNLQEDAMRALNMIALEVDESDFIPPEDRGITELENGCCFYDDYGITYDEAAKHLAAMVAQFRILCSKSFETEHTWPEAVKMVCKQLGEDAKKSEK